MPKCRACGGTGFIVRDNGRLACQVCKGTGMVTDGDRADRTAAISSDMKGCVLGILAGGLLAWGGYILGGTLGAQIAGNMEGNNATLVKNFAPWLGATAGFLAGFAISRIGR